MKQSTEVGMMTNTRLVKRTLEACARFERKEVSTGSTRRISIAELQALLEGNASALEGGDKKVYAEIHKFSNALERIQFACLLERQHEETCSLIKLL